MNRLARMFYAGCVAAALVVSLFPGTVMAGAKTDDDAMEARLLTGPSSSDLSAYAYRNNPMIQAARKEWQGVAERYRLETALENPELMTEGMYMTEGFGMSVKPDDWKIGVTQALPWPGQREQAGEIVKADARIARLKLDLTVRDVTVSLRESFQELTYFKEARRIAAANRELLEQLKKAGDNAYANNRVALIDVLKAQSQSGQLQYDDLLLRELEKTETTRINALLNRPPEAVLGPIAEEPFRPVLFTLGEVYALAATNLEEVRLARAGEDKAQAMISLSRYENLPEFKVGLSYGSISQQEQVGLQVGLMIPLWSEKNAGRLGVAEADLERMKAMRQNQINESTVMVRDNWFRLESSERLIKLYRDDLIPQAFKAVESAGVLFKQGQGSFSDYVETQSAWYNFQLALARAKADYGKYLVRLEKLAGRPLTDKNSETGATDAKDGTK